MTLTGSDKTGFCRIAKILTQKLICKRGGGECTVALQIFEHLVIVTILANSYKTLSQGRQEKIRMRAVQLHMYQTTIMNHPLLHTQIYQSSNRSLG